MFLEFLVTFRYPEAPPWFCFRPSKGKNYHSFVCILGKIFSTINHTFFWFYVLKNHIFDGSPYTVHRAIPVVTLVIVPMNTTIWIKVGHHCKNKSGPKLWCPTITPYIKHRVILELWKKSIIKLMHENATIREWSVASDVTVKFLFKSVPSIPRV